MRSQGTREAAARTGVAAPAGHGHPLLEAARGGNAAAFERLTAPFERELHALCYRKLGTVHDADDAAFNGNPADRAAAGAEVPSEARGETAGGDTPGGAPRSGRGRGPSGG